MRSLEDIFTHGSGERRILFEDGLWCIYERERGDGVKYSYAIHRCEKAEYALDRDGPWECGSTKDDLYDGIVYGCGEAAPDSIKTLVTIHRWER